MGREHFNKMSVTYLKPHPDSLEMHRHKTGNRLFFLTPGKVELLETLGSYRKAMLQIHNAFIVYYDKLQNNM